ETPDRRPIPPLARRSGGSSGLDNENRSFRITACTPQFPSTTCVTPKSTAMVISEMASSSLSFLVVIRKRRILRNASRRARSTDDFLIDVRLRVRSKLRQVVGVAEAVHQPFVLSFQHRIIERFQRGANEIGLLVALDEATTLQVEGQGLSQAMALV